MWLCGERQVGWRSGKKGAATSLSSFPNKSPSSWGLSILNQRAHRLFTAIETMLFPIRPIFKHFLRKKGDRHCTLISCTICFRKGSENLISYPVCFWSRFHPHRSEHLHQSSCQVHRHEQQTLLGHQRGWSRCDLRSKSNTQLTGGNGSKRTWPCTGTSDLLIL